MACGKKDPIIDDILITDSSWKVVAVGRLRFLLVVSGDGMQGKGRIMWNSIVNICDLKGNHNQKDMKLGDYY